MRRLGTAGLLIGLTAMMSATQAASPCAPLEGRYRLINPKTSSSVEILLQANGRFSLEESFGEQRHSVPGRWTRANKTLTIKADPAPPPRFLGASPSPEWLKFRGTPSDPRVVLQVQVVTAQQGLEWKQVTVEATMPHGQRILSKTASRGVAELATDSVPTQSVVALTVSDPARQVPAQRFPLPPGTRSVIIELESRALQPRRLDTQVFTIQCSDPGVTRLLPADAERTDVYFERIS